MDTVMLALPLAKLIMGVNNAVRVRPVPLMAPKVPPETLRSPDVPFQAKLAPGSSENEKVILAVSLALSVATLLAMLTVGARVSIEMLGVVPALPELPALSA